MRIVQGLVLFFALAASVPAHAIVSNCFPPIVALSPAHPGTNDRVDIYVTWAIAYRFGDTVYVSGPTQSDNTFALNVLIAGDTAPAGYREIGKFAYPDYDYVLASLDPLPIGQYSVHVTMLELDANGTPAGICPDPTINFTVNAQPAATQAAVVVEYYHPALDHYFITQNGAEMADLDNGVHPGWARTGQSFSAYTPGNSDARGNPACRWYASPANVDSHFFSASSVECIHVNTPYNGGIWRQETDDAFEIPLPNVATGECRTGTIPVYRLWNGRADSNHRYTTSAQIKQEMLAKGYIAEGYGPKAVAMCAPQ